MTTNRFEPFETQIVSKLLPQVDYLVNVGANIGWYCCLALQQRRSVIAFEPLEQNLQGLLRNIDSNGWITGFEVYPIAIGGRVGQADFFGWGTGASFIQGWAGASKSHHTKVPVNTLDNVLQRKLRGHRTLLIVDIEGGEEMFIDGATQFLSADPKPLILIEISHNSDIPATTTRMSRAKLIERMVLMGYSACAVASDGRVINLEIGASAFPKVCDDRTIHNFFFSDSKISLDLAALSGENDNT